MSGGTLAQAVGFGIGQSTEPTLEEAEKAVLALVPKIGAAFEKYGEAKGSLSGVAPELLAHRAQVLVGVVGELVGAACTLQRAAYAKATT